MARRRSSGSSKESPIRRPFTGDLWPKIMVRSMNSTGRQYQLVPGTIFHRAHDWNTIRGTTPPMYLTRTGIRSKSSIKASDGTLCGSPWPGNFAGDARPPNRAELVLFEPKLPGLNLRDRVCPFPAQSSPPAAQNNYDKAL